MPLTGSRKRRKKQNKNRLTSENKTVPDQTTPEGAVLSGIIYLLYSANILLVTTDGMVYIINLEMQQLRVNLQKSAMDQILLYSTKYKKRTVCITCSKY